MPLRINEPLRQLRNVGEALTRASAGLQAQLQQAGSATSRLQEQIAKVESVLHSIQTSHRGKGAKMPALVPGHAHVGRKEKRLIAWCAPWCAAMAPSLLSHQPVLSAQLLHHPHGRRTLAESVVQWCCNVQPQRTMATLLEAICEADDVKASLCNANKMMTRHHQAVMDAILRHIDLAGMAMDTAATAAGMAATAAAAVE